MKYRLSVLCDDAAATGEYLAEHGLSILVGLPNGRRWLMDTGTSDVFLRNAGRMGLSLDGLAGIVITHGHDDHTGGLAFYPRLGGAPPVYGHPCVFAKQYEVRKGEPVRVLGMPDRARRYADPAFRPVRGTVELDEDLYLFTDIPREPGSHAPVEGKFFHEDGTGPCPILEDATLAIRTPRGLVAVFGCAHAGYVNILKAIRRKFPGVRLLAVAGGLHLSGADERVLSDAAAYTDTFRDGGWTLHGGHCTGAKALAYIRERYGDDAVKPLGAGRVIEF
jgi:7,8-dihydropterin-6-yl-methyl-4-(beta-D-ribofuranosyl)aminobenzene 5'-phosphate synthase